MRRHMSVLGGVGMLNGLLGSEGRVELGVLSASYLGDMFFVCSWCCFVVFGPLWKSMLLNLLGSRNSCSL